MAPPPVQPPSYRHLWIAAGALALLGLLLLLWRSQGPPPATVAPAPASLAGLPALETGALPPTATPRRAPGPAGTAPRGLAAMPANGPPPVLPAGPADEPAAAATPRAAPTPGAPEAEERAATQRPAATEPAAPAEEASPAIVFSTDREGIRAAMREISPAVRECYGEWLKLQPDLGGTVRLSFSIQAAPDAPDGGPPRGRVAEVDSADSSLEHPFVRGCLQRSVEDLQFEAPSAGPLRVTYPFTFRPALPAPAPAAAD